MTDRKVNEFIGAPRRARNVCAILLLQLAASCSAWRPLPGAGLARVESERLGHAKVFLRDGTELELDSATVRRDSIIGFGGVAPYGRLAVARSDVAGIDMLSTDVTKTFLLGVLAPVLLAFLYTLALRVTND